MNDLLKTHLKNNLVVTEEKSAIPMERWRVFLFRAFFVLTDIILLTLALVASYALRFNFVIPSNHLVLMAFVFPFVVGSEIIAMTLFGCFRLLWRTFSAVDLPRFLGAIGSSLVFMLVCRFLFRDAQIRFFPPISIAFMNGVFSVALLMGGRWLVRMLAETGSGDGERKRAERLRRVVIVGSGDARSAIVYALQHGTESSRVVVGFLDNAPEALGTIIHGIPVLGCISDAERVLHGRSIDEVIVVPGTLVREGMQSLFSAVASIGARLLMAPGYSTVLDRVSSGHKLRDAEITDLLRRRAMPLDILATHSSCLMGRRVMVTGAGGSIGSEIARQAMRAGASVLILVERSEYALFMIHRELAEMMPGAGTIVRRYVADIGNEDYMRQILSNEKAEIVFHAAAYKHVPLMEENVCEAIRNNVFATQSFAKTCVDAGVNEFVLLSSDKAVAPSSVMGATKRMCEILLNGLNTLGKTAFMAVRFGNVLGSTGSVVPIFRDQIERGGPVTITHPEMTRYFMTIPEAVSLTIEAVATGDKGRGCVYVLDMGDPIRIVELAEEMIKLVGKIPGEDIPITFVGIRPGEKLHEQLSLENEKINPTENPQIGVGRLSSVDGLLLREFIEKLRIKVAQGEENEARKLLMEFCLKESWEGKEYVA